MREIRRLSDDDLSAAQRVRFAAYGQPDDLEAANARFAPLISHTFGSFQGGKLLSVATVLPTQAYLGGELRPFGAVAGIATAPEARRRGHVTGLIKAWFEELRSQGCGFSGEFPFDLAYYNRFGYQSVRRGRMLEVPISRFGEYLAGTGNARRRTDAESVDHFDPRVAAVFDEFVSRYDFSFARDNGPPMNRWSRALTPYWSLSDRYTYLFDGAYLSVHLADEDVMTVRDYAWLNASGRADVLAFIADLQGNYEKARLFLPSDEPLLVEWESTYSVETNVYQLRIIDIERALSGFRSQVEGELRIRVVDEQCPWNDGVFELNLSPDGSQARRGSGGAVDVSLGQRALVALICGSVTPPSLLSSGGAEGDMAALAMLSRLRDGRTLYLPEADAY